jgi:hypothetical protein
VFPDNLQLLRESLQRNAGLPWRACTTKSISSVQSLSKDSKDEQGKGDG